MNPLKNDSSAVFRLRENRNLLIESFAAGEGTGDFIRRHTAILDQYFTESFEKSIVGPRMQFHKQPFALVALGGYGRQELCLHSDIDILILFKRRVPEESEALIREVIYPLWDEGFEVGHAVRSITECLRLAADDVEVFTSLLNARFLCGMSPLYARLREGLNKYLSRKRAGKMLRHLVEGNACRHLRFGDASYLLEPNLKEGRGGLRDYHTVIWAAHFITPIIAPRDLEYNGHLSHDEYQLLQNALAFIRAVRNWLHYLSGRKADQLFFEYQIQIADILKFQAASGQIKVERFLGELHRHLELIKQTNLVFLKETAHTSGIAGKRGPSAGRPSSRGLEIKRHMLDFISSERILTDPRLLIKIFKESCRLKLPLSAEARRIVKEFSYLIDDEFRRDPFNIKAFEHILVTPVAGFSVLDAMHSTGFLTRFIPAMEAVVNRIQYNGYHIHSIDRHLLRTVQVIKQGIPQKGTDRLAADLYEETAHNRAMLLWAALLHDIGKGVPAPDHAGQGARTAYALLTGFGYPDRFVDTVSFLVREHLLLVHTATRRDINDEETAVSCARRIKDPDRLKMLYILTAADAMATGPAAWSDWTAALLRDLFFKMLNIIETGETASRETVDTVAAKKTSLLETAGAEDEHNAMAAHIDRLSHRYLLHTPADDIAAHFLLFRRLGHRPFNLDVTGSGKGRSDFRTVTICAKDRPGLFSKITGVLTKNGIDILNADIFTWKNSIALDIFTVKPPPDLLYENDRWEKVDADLASALNGTLDPGAALVPAAYCKSATPAGSEPPDRIKIDNHASSFFTIIEIFCRDFHGLLFHVTNTLYRQKLDVKTAKIASRADQIVAVFYVRNFYGEKIMTEEKTSHVRAALASVLSHASLRTDCADRDDPV